MSSSAVRKRKNPQEWAYTKLLHGKHINPLHLNKMFRNYYEEEKQRMIEDMLRASGQIAVSSAILTRRMREKYEERRFKQGRNVYYLFPNQYIPADVGALLQIKPGGLIYELPKTAE